MEDPIPEQGVFGRSDHYPFVTRGVPALMLVGSPEATKEGFVKRFNEFEETKYHQPNDDVYKDWHWPGAKTVADMMGILGYRIAQADSMPTWLPGNKYSKLRRGDTLPQ
jgi:Zn-dependent M28 family amino/carboxypeptidase